MYSNSNGQVRASAIKVIRGAAIIVAASVGFIIAWNFAEHLRVQLRERSFVSALRPGQTVNDVKRIALRQGLEMNAGAPGVFVTTAGSVGRPLTPCSDTYYVDTVFRDGHLAEHGTHRSMVCF